MQGKLAQRGNMMEKRLIGEPEELFDLVFDASVLVQSLVILTDDVVLVQYQQHEDYGQENSIGNVVLASFVTAYGRLKLHKTLLELGDRALYWDTDSVLYYEGEDDAELVMGDHLGDLTSEVPDGHRILEYCSGGPKNYAYIVENMETKEQKTVIKVKGLSLNHNTSGVLGYSDMKRLIRAYVQTSDHNETIGVPTMQFRKTNDYGMFTVEYLKKYSVVYTKRILKPDFTTRPYGYINP